MKRGVNSVLSHNRAMIADDRPCNLSKITLNQVKYDVSVLATGYNDRFFVQVKDLLRNRTQNASHKPEQ